MMPKVTPVMMAAAMSTPTTIVGMARLSSIPINAAMVVGMGLYTVLNYLGQRFFAFKSSKSEDTDDHVAD